MATKFSDEFGKEFIEWMENTEREARGACDAFGIYDDFYRADRSPAFAKLLRYRIQEAVWKEPGERTPTEEALSLSLLLALGPDRTLTRILENRGLEPLMCAREDAERERERLGLLPNSPRDLN